MDATPIDTTAPTHDAHRLTFAYFAHQLQHYLHLDKGLPRTFVDLIWRPGTMLRDYFAGTARARYTNPIAYSLLAAAASLVAYGWYRAPYIAWMRSQMLSGLDPRVDTFVRALAENIFAATEHMALVSGLLAVPMGVLLWLFFRSPRFNLAEALAFALYATGTFLFVHALLIAPLMYFTHAWQTAQSIGMSVQMATMLTMGLGLFGRRWGNAVRLMLAFGLSFAVWLVALGLGVYAYTAATI
ncbi:DUF3667 domain-containing protein [Lysobacter sp. TY2-98]|uniref:DUF3667 domain-containing protein n=1 Tax=Lysobacter sp. TY2-98 TaxID=2290922 RepID=UPI0013B3F4CD|nr:DUF3667 domain-containing protein [Lysobacter sp. TY2-98]